jgi:hypothetical protein
MLLHAATHCCYTPHALPALVNWIKDGITIFTTTTVLRAAHGAEHNAMFNDINAMYA